MTTKTLLMTLRLTLEDLPEGERKTLARDAMISLEDLPTLGDVEAVNIADKAAYALSSETGNTIVFEGGDDIARITDAEAVSALWETDAAVPLSKAIRRCLDLSTDHIEASDIREFARLSGEFGLPRSVQHGYGMLLFLSSEPDVVAGHIKEMRLLGFSEKLLSIYENACELGGEVMLINFDADAALIEGLPVRGD